jgi:uncharacterized membrane protein YGL010W
MRTLDSYLHEYAQSHTHPLNKAIHTLAVPLIMWSLLGFLHSFEWADVHLSYVMIAIVLAYYASFKKPLLLIAMGLITSVMIASFLVVPHLRWVSAVVFLLSWIAQFYGHKVEGKKPSFFKDLLFLLIGPLWVVVKACPSLLGHQALEPGSGRREQTSDPDRTGR